MHVVSHVPVVPDFRAKSHYSNWMYSIVRNIETVDGEEAAQDLGNFTRRRIFNPLKYQDSNEQKRLSRREF